MATTAARATQLEAAADRDTTLAAENEQQSGLDATEGETLEDEAAMLVTKSEQDEALAASDQAVADELTGQAAEEEEQAVSHFGKAAADETLAEGELAEATAEAAEASETESTAHGEEIGTGVCEFIPFLDVVCDVVGGTAAVGLEVTAAREAAEAAAGFAAAATAKADEESELALAGELQAKAAGDAEAAAELEAEADAFEAEAAEEAAEANQEEALAEERFEQSEMEEDAAQEEVSEATEEHAESASSWEESMRYGVGACWDLIVAASIGTAALAFFSFRIMASHIVPGATTFMFDYVPLAFRTRGMQGSRHMQVLSNIWRGTPMKLFSVFFLHCAIFIMTAGAFGDLLSAMGSYSMRSRGGVIVLFSAAAACLQGLLLHAVPHLMSAQKLRAESLSHSTLRASDMMAQCFLTFLLSLLWLLPLFSMELLILWINFGSEMFSPSLKSSFCTWYLWLIFALVMAVHYTIFEIQLNCFESYVESGEEYQKVVIETESSPLMTGKYGHCTSTVAKSYQSSINTEDMSSVITDDDLRSKETKRLFQMEHSAIPRPHSVLQQSVVRDLSKLRLPFEVLIISCMVAILRSCIPNALRLWPVFKSTVIALHPHWFLLPLACIGTAIAFCFAFHFATRTSSTGPEVHPRLPL